MKQDRFLIGILVGIAVLVAVALAVFFARQPVSYGPEQSPEGVVHNYVLAVLNNDYQKAYGYLADLDDKPTFDEFRRAFAVGRLSPRGNGVRIGAAHVAGDGATVELTVVYTPSDPFSEGFDSPGSAQLVQQDGAWKISSMPTYDLWDFSWYQLQPK